MRASNNLNLTRNIATYIRDLGINLSELSRKTGIPYNRIYDSLGREDAVRDLRAEELAKICCAVHINPMDFYDPEEAAV